jgi:hypothetical protein
MNTYTRIYPIWYAEVQIDNHKVYDEVVDFLCEHTGKPYSFRLTVEGYEFNDVLHFHEPEQMSKNAQHIIKRARETIENRGVDVLIFKSVKEINR